jgi:hypothetical protein
MVAHDKAGVQFVNGPRWRKPARVQARFHIDLPQCSMTSWIRELGDLKTGEETRGIKREAAYLDASLTSVMWPAGIDAQAGALALHQAFLSATNCDGNCPRLFSKFLGYSVSGETPSIPFGWCAIGAHKTSHPPKYLILFWPSCSRVLTCL